MPDWLVALVVIVILVLVVAAIVWWWLHRTPRSASPAAVAAPAVAAGPHGPGSAAPLAGGAAPSPAYTIKGNADSMLYHTPESPYFGRTIAEVWFLSAADAERAGFKRWDRKS
jgi:hypothetical protein